MDQLFLTKLFFIVILMYCTFQIAICASTSSSLLVAYNKIPSFDFNYHNISKAMNLTDVEAKCSNFASHVVAIKSSGLKLNSSTLFYDTSLLQSCVGYNSEFWYKYDLQNPTMSASNFYVHAVTIGMFFAQIVGWYTNGTDLSGMPLIVPTVSACAHLCALSKLCVGAVWGPNQTKCWLKANYGPPIQISNFNMLIPVGNTGCPTSVIASGNCIIYVSNDLSILCEIMVAWNLYSDESICLLHIQFDYSSNISFENDGVTSISVSYIYLSGGIPSTLAKLTGLQYLDLSSNQLKGTIPSELSQLTALKYLDLSSNQLTGTIPSELSQLTVLQYFDLSINQLTGTIPSELSQLTVLQYFDLSINQLTGTIPSELSQLTALQIFYLNYNQLTGSIPSQLSQLTALQYLYLNYNQLTSMIPSQLSQLVGLQYLDLTYNQLTGTIPSQLSQLAALQNLDLDYNQLTGSIPSQLSQLTALQYLDLTYNELTGTIPSQLSQLTALKYLDPSYNQLTGTIPSQLSQLTTLQYLDLSINLLTDTIPSQLSQLSALQNLDLSINLLTDTIPSQLSQLTALQNLDLSYNQLTGTIPSQLSQLTALQYLYLSYNQLTGTIPSQLSQLTGLQYLYLNYNQLTGTIPSQLSQLTALQNLYLYYNELTSTIPSQLSQLTALQNLYLNYNQLTGSIPSQLSQLTALQLLYLSDNQLTGTIPSQLSQLTALQYLYLSNNQLTGTIADAICNISSLLLIQVSGLTCPISCSNKCISFPAVVSSSASPTNLRVIKSNPSSTLNTSSIIGIVVGIFGGMSVILLALYYFIMPRCNKRHENTKMEENKGSLTNPNNLEIFSWNDFAIDSTSAITVVGEGSFSVVVRTKLITENKENLSESYLIAANEDLVIKIIKNDNISESEFILKEVQIHVDTTKKIVNKNCIVKLYGLVEGQLSLKFSRMLNVKTAFGIVMRYEAGGSLDSILYTDIVNSTSPYSTAADSNTKLSLHTSSDLKNTQVELSLVQKIYILHKIAQSLAELHRAGVIHGDLKPDNILLSSKDILLAEICLADFGCSDLRDKNSSEIGTSSLVQTVHQRGTPVYSAPEQMYNPFSKSKNSVLNEATYAKASIKTDIYSFAILSWEILTQQKPYSNISSPIELAVIVHQGIRPDIQLLPADCPLAIKNMIERCWDADRSSRLTALECFTILRDYYSLLSTIKYDIYLSYRHSDDQQIINRVKSQLLGNGFKIASFENITDSVNKRDELNQRIELIKQSKIVLLCLDFKTQTDSRCLYELGNNRGFKYPRPVIPLFLESRQRNFPDNEIKVHCYMGCSDTKIFDISNFINDSSNLKSENVNIIIDEKNEKLNDTQIGLDPFDIEINRLIEYIHSKINEDHIRY